MEIIGGGLTDEEWADVENEQEENNLDENGIRDMKVVDIVEEHQNVYEIEATGDSTDVASSSVQKNETASLDPKNQSRFRMSE